MCSRAEGQFTVAPPQHLLYFFPEPHGHGSFRPTLGVLRRDSLAWVLGLTCRCALKYRYAPNSPAAMCTMISSRHEHDEDPEMRPEPIRQEGSWRSRGTGRVDGFLLRAGRWILQRRLQ